MLKRILSITGRPGLYRLLSQGKNCLIVESVSEQPKRMPVFNNEKVMSLGDIAIYTQTAEKPLSEVFEDIKEKFEGKTVDVKALEKDGTLRSTFAEILPDFDDERVRNNDIKKVFSWYNTLITNGIDDFKDVEEEETAEEPEAEKENKED